MEWNACGGHGVQATLFQTECKKTFPQIASHNIPENYRSVPSVVRTAEAVANCTSSRRRTEPVVMRGQDIPVTFTRSGNEVVCTFGMHVNGEQACTRFCLMLWHVELHELAGGSTAHAASCLACARGHHR